MALQIILVLLIAGLAELDRTCVFHGLFSEPIALAPVVGYVLGEPALGLQIGAILQLFFLGGVSMGGSSPLDGTMSAVAVVVAATAAARFTGADAAVVCPAAVLLVMAPAAMVGRAIDIWIKEKNVGLAHEVENDIENTGQAAIGRAVWKGVGRSFVVFTLATGVVSFLGAAATAGVLYLVPDELRPALKVVGVLLLAASAGIALASLREKRAMWAYFSASVVLWAIATVVV